MAGTPDDFQLRNHFFSYSIFGLQPFVLGGGGVLRTARLSGQSAQNTATSNAARACKMPCETTMRLGEVVRFFSDISGSSKIPGRAHRFVWIHHLR